MGTRILIVQGHPDCSRPHLCHAFAAAYAEGARGAGHEVEILEPARLRLPLLESQDAWRDGAPPPGVAQAQEAILHARHLVFFYPLWLGDMPALLKGFLEQVARPGFALDPAPRNPLRAGLLGGRSARLVVTMGTPAPFYRWVYGAHSVKLMRRNILGYAGIAPVHSTIVGGVGGLDAAAAKRWFGRMRRLGARAA